MNFTFIKGLIFIFIKNLKMKKMFFCFLTLIIANTINSQNIGIVRNAQHRITANLDPIKKEWEKLLADQNNPAALVNFEIVSGLDSKTNKTYYILLASNRDKSIKVAKALKLSNGYLAFLKGVENPKGVIICSGCSNGCIPSVVDEKWSCGDCMSDGACDKSETVIEN